MNGVKLKQRIVLPLSLLAFWASRGIAGNCLFLGEGVLVGVPPTDRELAGAKDLWDDVPGGIGLLEIRKMDKGLKRNHIL